MPPKPLQEDTPEELPVKVQGEGLIIHVRLTPKGGRTAIEGVGRHGGAAVLKVRVAVPPEDGKANAALIAALADWLDVAKSNLSLASGAKSRQKSVFVASPPDRLLTKIARLLSIDENKKGDVE